MIHQEFLNYIKETSNEFVKQNLARNYEPNLFEYITAFQKFIPKNLPTVGYTELFVSDAEIEDLIIQGAIQTPILKMTGKLIQSNDMIIKNSYTGKLVIIAGIQLSKTQIQQLEQNIANFGKPQKKDESDSEY